jgi:tetratricopeptide (TPR) repeat protein
MAACYFNRALAFAALRDAGRALDDYTRALELDPTLSAAALNRGMLHYEAGRHDEARADLGRALELGADPATAHYDLALIHLARGNHSAALASVRRSLEYDAARPDAVRLRDRLEAERRPGRAARPR